MAPVAPNHAMYRVGPSSIWCCSHCGYSVQVTGQGEPSDRPCYGTFQGYIDWLFDTIREEVKKDH